jgi:hypothetical protein
LEQFNCSKWISSREVSVHPIDTLLCSYFPFRTGKNKGWRSPVLIGLVMDKDENSTQTIAEMAGKRPPGEQTPGLL